MRRWLALVLVSIFSLGVIGVSDAYVQCIDVNRETFEGTSGGWTGYRNSSSTISWTLRTSSPMGATAPPQDHTFANGSGHYAYVDSYVARDRKIILDSPVLTVPDRLHQDCYATFYYSMEGTAARLLQVYTQRVSSSKQYTAWQRQNSQCNNGTWQLGQAKLTASIKNSFVVSIAATVTSDVDPTADISVDDITVTCCTGCRDNLLSLATFTSSFDGYTQLTSGDHFNWTRNSGGTASSSTGPVYDHTVGDPGCTGTTGSHYVYTEASKPRVAGDRATMLSPVFQPPDGTNVCFATYWLNMNGQDIKQLRVQVNVSGTLEATECFNGHRTTNRFWVLASTAFRPRGMPFQLNFTGERGTSFVGDIALDDIEVSCCSDSCEHFAPRRFECGDDGFYAILPDQAWYRRGITTGAGFIGRSNNYVLFSNGTQIAATSYSLSIPAASSYNCTLEFYLYVDVPVTSALTVLFQTNDSTRVQFIWILLSTRTPGLQVETVEFTFSPVSSTTSFTLMWHSLKTAAWKDMFIDNVEVACCPLGGTITAVPTTAQATTPTTTPTSTPTSTPTATPTSTTITTPYDMMLTSPSTSAPTSTTAPSATSADQSSAGSASKLQARTSPYPSPGTQTSMLNSSGPTVALGTTKPLSDGLPLTLIYACSFGGAMLILLVVITILVLRRRRAHRTISLASTKAARVANPAYEPTTLDASDRYIEVDDNVQRANNVNAAYEYIGNSVPSQERRSSAQLSVPDESEYLPSNPMYGTGTRNSQEGPDYEEATTPGPRLSGAMDTEYLPSNPMYGAGTTISNAGADYEELFPQATIPDRISGTMDAEYLPSNPMYGTGTSGGSVPEYDYSRVYAQPAAPPPAPSSLASASSPSLLSSSSSSLPSQHQYQQPTGERAAGKTVGRRPQYSHLSRRNKSAAQELPPAAPSAEGYEVLWRGGGKGTPASAIAELVQELDYIREETPDSLPKATRTSRKLSRDIPPSSFEHHAADRDETRHHEYGEAPMNSLTQPGENDDSNV